MALPHIQIGDGLLGDALLSSVEVKQALNDHWWCTVVCRGPEDGRIPTEDLLGQTVSITTADDDGTEHIHFSGFVYDVSLTYEIWGSYTAHLIAVSDSYRLDVTAHKQYYPEGTLSSVAGIIAGRGGLTIAVNAPGSKALDYVQYGETDFSLLHRMVDDAGAWLRPKAGGGVEIFASFQSGTSVAWRNEGDGLLHFAISGSLAPPCFSGSHYDHHVMQSNTFTNVSKPPSFFDGAGALTGAVQSASHMLPSAFEPQRARAMALDAYQEQLQSESERALGAAVTGEGQSRNQNLKAGDTVAVSGALDAQGTYGLASVTHQWTASGYINRFVCTPWKNYRNPQAPVMRRWEGVVPASVVGHNDPKKMGRLQVQFFWQQDGSTHWARMLSSHAGPDRGLMFMPEVGDEVAVMFEDGDPERPLIVGSMWNGVQQAPRAGFFAPDADIPDNNVKRILTKSGNRLHMIDTPDVETIHMATPHHTTVSMTDKDGVTGRPLVYLHSDGDIVLNAPAGRVHINSLLFSRETGPSAAPAAPAAPAPAGSAGGAAVGAAAGAAASGAAERVNHNGISSPQPKACAGQGMDNDADRKQFVARMKTLQTGWHDMSPNARAQALLDAGNEQTAKQGVPPMGGTITDMDSDGAFNHVDWKMEINSKLVNKPYLSDQDTADAADTIYHESRHSETTYAAVRNEAANTPNLQQLNAKIITPSSVNAQALQHPMKYGDPGWGCAEAVKLSMFGPGAKQRSQTMRNLDPDQNAAKKAWDEYNKAIDAKADKGTLNRLFANADAAQTKADTTYTAYRALPGEADAWAVGDRVGDMMDPPLPKQ